VRVDGAPTATAWSRPCTTRFADTYKLLISSSNNRLATRNVVDSEHIDRISPSTTPDAKGKKARFVYLIQNGTVCEKAHDLSRILSPALSHLRYFDGEFPTLAKVVTMTADLVSKLGNMSATELKTDVPPEDLEQVAQVASLRAYGPITNRVKVALVADIRFLATRLDPAVCTRALTATCLQLLRMRCVCTSSIQRACSQNSIGRARPSRIALTY
jgi:hypothetical protein